MVAGRGLQVVPAQIKKVIQLYETMLVRHGVMLVGPTGSGKTTTYSVLQEVCENLHAAGLQDSSEFYQPVHTFVLNPKSITMGELYGEVNNLTLEWKDGLMGLTARHCVQVGEVNVLQLWEYMLMFVPCLPDLFARPLLQGPFARPLL